MVEQLTKAERQSCLAIVAGVCGVGLVLAIAGLRDPLGVHGSMIIALSLGAALFLLSRHDRPTTTGRQATMMIRYALASPSPWPGRSSAVRRRLGGCTTRLARTGIRDGGGLRPAHTTGVIFGFGGNALRATSFHVVQRTSRARLASNVLPWFVLFGYIQPRFALPLRLSKPFT